MANALNFEWDSRSNESVAIYRGLTIKAEQDSDCSNPWQDSDGMTPLLWTSGEGWNDETGVDDIESPLAAFKPGQVSRKWAELCKALDCDAAELERELKAEHKAESPRWRQPLAEYRRSKLEEILSDLKPSRGEWGAASDYLDALESLWRMAGVDALAFQRNGYSQGDSVLGLLVATPAWRERMGIERGRDMASDLKAQADTFGAWAFGDCYGFTIEDSEGETLDSCWGFVGSNFEESGLAEAAQSSADSILAYAAKKRRAKAAVLIRNRVPLEARPGLLEAAGQLESA